MLTQISFALVNGITSAMAVFLVAAGVTLIFGILRILNFAHGSFFMLGAYIALSLLGVQPGSLLLFLGVAILAGLAVAVFGLAANAVVFSRLRGLDEGTTLIATFALLLVCDGLVKFVWGLNYVSVPPPRELGGFFTIGRVFIPYYSLLIIALGVLIFVILDVVFHRLWIGKLVRALSIDPWMTTNLGINVPRIYAGVVVAAFFLAGLGGALLLPNQTLSPSLSGTYLLQAFVVVIIGGLGNVRGAFIASLILGLVDSLNFVVLPNVPGIAIYFAMVAFLIWRPQGLLTVADKASGEVELTQHAPEPEILLPRPARVGLLIAIAASLLLVPWWASPTLMFVIGLTLAGTVFALSWNLLFGYAGIATFGHAAFFAIGAYLVGYLLKSVPGIPFPVMLLFAVVVGATIAALVGLIALRRASGIALAILTLALSEILRMLIGYAEFLGSEDGLAGIPRPSLGGFGWTLSLADSSAYYLFMCVASGICILVLYLLTISRFGRVLKAIRQDPQRTEFLGVDIQRYRLLAFMIAGAVAAFAGAIQAPWTRIVTPELANYLHSTQPMLSALLGGTGYFWGPVVGSAAFSGLDHITRTLPGLADIIVGGFLLLVILIAPTGILGLLAHVLGSRLPQATNAAASVRKARA
jgi:branched-chain amino acid transport system permease protein